MLNYQTYTDAQLLQLLASEDESSFSELFNRYWDKLLSVAYHRTGDSSDAQEIVQVVFLNLWKKRATLQIDYSLSTYLSTAVKYEILNHFAEKSRRLRLNAAGNPANLSFHIQHELEFRDLQKIVQEKVKTLPEKCRIIYEMSRNEGMSNKQIASALQLSEKTIENQITIALRKLRSILPGPAAIIFLFL